MVPDLVDRLEMQAHLDLLVHWEMQDRPDHQEVRAALDQMEERASRDLRVPRDSLVLKEALVELEVLVL